jgi:PD-(D/E)XK endonuclease
VRVRAVPSPDAPVTPSEKGGIAELKIAAAAAAAGIVVLRPLTEGRRYDLVFDLGERLARVQCKWGRRSGDVITVRLATNRLTPRGRVVTTYSADEVDAVALYCEDNDGVYVLPIDEVAGQSYLYLRLGPGRNGQAKRLRWAAKYELGAIAQLGERLAGSQKVAGSSPASSTGDEAA